MAQPTSALREIRTRLGMSQTECAFALGVSVETFRVWDAGRRQAPDAIIERAQTLKVKRPTHERVPLRVLADELHISVRTLRAAARDGRLSATFSPRPFFGRLTATATREAATRFMATWYRKNYGRGRRRLKPVCRVCVPTNYASVLVGLRLRLGLSQQQLANEVGRPAKPLSTNGRAGSADHHQCSGLAFYGSDAMALNVSNRDRRVLVLRNQSAEGR